ncbi:malonate decarboxylase subunit delta [Neisseriaceae bacterium TC5R-5]|nr:malonate decarboxylase subunit delta [Neisseriaceae bacterium TC5R-5]
MEHYQFNYPAYGRTPQRAIVGVVGSGDLEVLLEPDSTDCIQVRVNTALSGTETIWRATLERVFTARLWPAVQLEINDFGASPGVIRLRLEQALEASQDAENSR